MGYDIVAYFDIDQKEIEQFINDNNIDRDKWDQLDVVADYYKDKYLKDDEYLKDSNNHRYFHLIYDWNEECEIHEIFTLHGTNFIRDDTRFGNRRFQKLLEEKLGRPFPLCLESINYTLRTSKDALEVAEELRVFFPNDINLIGFAEWLEFTAKYCSTYELSA